MAKPTFAIVVKFQIKPEHLASFRKRILQQASDSLRLEPGCRQFEVLTDDKDPATIVLYETYDDADAFEAHKRTEHFADHDHTVAGWVASKEVRRLTLVPRDGDI